MKTNINTTTNRIAHLIFNVGYYLIGTIQLVAGAVGMVYPFGILGDFTIFYSDDFASPTARSNDPNTAAAFTELMTLHLCRMCQVTAFFQGILFLVLRTESHTVRSKILSLSSLATIVYSLGEVYIDTPRAKRLGIDIYAETTPIEDYSRSIQFLLGCLNGGSLSTLILATVCFMIGIITPYYIVDETTTTITTTTKVKKTK